MTATALITLLKNERNRIQRIEGWSNLTLEFTMKNREKLTLTPSETGLFFIDYSKEGAEVSDGVLRIGWIDPAKRRDEHSDNGTTHTITLYEGIEYRYIIAENVETFAFQFERKTVTTINLQQTEEGGE
jgi:hypothetical protein